jgi:hypothetical protein
MTGCINYLIDLALYLGVSPVKLAKEVQTLKLQNKSNPKMAEEGQQAWVDQERLRELEAKNKEMERTLASMGEVLQQHTSRWATAQAMLEKLECLASPAVFVGGQAFLRGLQKEQTPQMAGLLLHMLSTLPNEVGQKILETRGLVVQP